MSTPLISISSLTIGTVESVYPDDIRILLDIDAPISTSLNTGIPTSFPKINSYVLLPNEAGLVVGIITWIGIEKSMYPKQKGFKDFGLVDLPFPLRKLSLAPLGMLKQNLDTWELERGITSYPSIGDQAILPTREQTKAIVTGKNKDARIPLGTCPMAFNAPISIDPDRLFGRHLAVLGNTGSGKSCTLAALIRSSVQAAENKIKTLQIKDNFGSSCNKALIPNTRFIILDPNGEYTECFKDVGVKNRVFKVPPIDDLDTFESFVLPAWMWNSFEWAAIVQASSKTQRPLLQTALRNLRSERELQPSWEKRLLRNCRGVKTILSKFRGSGTTNYQQQMECGNTLARFLEDLNKYEIKMQSSYPDKAASLKNEIEELIDKRYYISKEGRQNFNLFGDMELQTIVDSLDEILSIDSENEEEFEITEDSPRKFETSELADHIELLAQLEGDNSTQYISTMIMRIKSLLADQRISEIVAPHSQPLLATWLESQIGADEGLNGPIAVIDLSLIPHEILHIIIAIAARLILEALQRYRKIYSNNLPTVLVLEEAHTFISKRLSHSEDIPSSADMCRSIFERIAREGRKFGLGLVLSSQRPSELSETVLSQCNSFILHRITNDRDQELLSRLVPDNTRGLLRELPSLPTRHCVLLGEATQIPTLVEIPELEPSHRPTSDNPDFWDVWTNKSARPIDWQTIVTDWKGS